MRCESTMMLDDCLAALRRFRSSAFLVPTVGAFISHTTPPMTMSAVVTRCPWLARTNLTECPACARASAVLSSWGQTFAPGSIMISPLPKTTSPYSPLRLSL